MGMLADRVAIVTGGGQGIGRGVASALAKEGARVCVVGRTAEKIDATVEMIKGAGGTALALALDVSNREECYDVVEATVAAFGPVDILVNNAATNQPQRIEAITDQDFYAVLGSSLMATIYMMQACFPHMRERGGKIINFGSGAGTMGSEGNGSYAAAKEAIRGLTKTAAREWGRYRININVVCPAAWTPLVESVWAVTGKSPETELLNFPLGRFGDPERDIGRTCVFLAGPDSDYITGRTIHVDGGRSFYDM